MLLMVTRDLLHREEGFRKLKTDTGPRASRGMEEGSPGPMDNRASLSEIDLERDYESLRTCLAETSIEVLHERGPRSQLLRQLRDFLNKAEPGQFTTAEGDGTEGHSPQSGVVTGRAPLARDKVMRHLRHQAYCLGQSRRLAGLERFVEYLTQVRSQIFVKLRGTSEDMNADWRDAKALFALDCLEGRIPFPSGLLPETFSVLESVWLEDVKRVKAYLLWEKCGAGWDPPNQDGHYFSAGAELRALLLDSRSKATLDHFDQVRNYLGTYLSDGRADCTYLMKTRLLVEAKARRLGNLSGCAGPDPCDWHFAVDYVTGLYNNLIDAVKNRNAHSASALFKAMSDIRTGRQGFQIINAFEMAVIIAFLDPEVIRRSGIDLGNVI